MAHADYACCAICDTKLYFSHDAPTKEEICAMCFYELKSAGIELENQYDIEGLPLTMPAESSNKELEAGFFLWLAPENSFLRNYSFLRNLRF